MTAVEAGTFPLNMAIEIARSNDKEVQQALTQAYTEKKLRGKKLVAVRKIIEHVAAASRSMTAGLDEVTAPSAR